MSLDLESTNELNGTTSNEVERLREILGSLVYDECVQRLAKVWDYIGIEEEQRQERREVIVQHMRGLLTDMVEEEENLKEKMLTSIRENLEKLKVLRMELKLTVALDEDKLEGMTVKVREKTIRERVDKLNQTKHDRMKRFKRLTEMEMALCRGLDEHSQLTSHYQAQRLPSEQDLQEYRDRIDRLSSIKDQRQVEFLNTRVKAQQIWSELEWTPKEEIGKALAEGDVGKFVFSVENMARVQHFYQELEKFATSQQKKAIWLRSKVSSLWERLEEPVEEKELFLQQHQGYNLPTIQALEDEVKRLNILKQHNMARFIEATRAELNKIWDKCYYGPMQRQEFVLCATDECTEDVLSAHESELDRMRGFYSDNADLFKLVEKRENMWKQKLEFDARANDPSRLMNRGGKLLAEQKAQARLMKQLPKVEEQVKSAATAWEESYSRPFFVQDHRYIDTIEDQWSEYKLSKESEKNQKKKVKEETTMQEMKFGSRPITPARKRPAVPTPTSANKTKMRKIAPSPLIHATTSSRRKITPRSRVQSKRRCNILSERNYSTTSSSSSGGVGGSREESMVKSADTSLASTVDYHEFKRGLSQGLHSSKTARSSVVGKN